MSTSRIIQRPGIRGLLLSLLEDADRSPSIEALRYLQTGTMYPVNGTSHPLTTYGELGTRG
jgi:hypothetical protein